MTDLRVTPASDPDGAEAYTPGTQMLVLVGSGVDRISVYVCELFSQ